MSPMTALWFASVIGAALFFASGVLSAEVLQRALGVKPRRILLPANDAAIVRVSRSQPQATNPALAEAAAADDRTRFAAYAVNEVAQARSAARAHRTEADALRQQLRALERELARARRELGHVDAQLAASVSTQRLALEADLDRLKQELRGRNQRVEVLTERVAELSAHAEESSVLRTERDTLRRELERLTRSPEAVTPPPAVPTARVQLDRVGMATITRPSQSGTRRVREPENTLEARLTRNLSGLIAREPAVVAVLSDENGFPVAAVGSDQQQEGVSLLASLAQELALRVKEFVDLDRIERLELADATGRALRVRLFDWETQPLALACLGKRSLIANPDEELVVTAFPTLLRKVSSA